MRDIFYDIQDFNWDNESNTLSANSNSLYDILQPHYFQLSFPNQRSKFYIKNPKTNGFRRFLYKKEVPLNKSEVIWIFESEDGIKCEITTKAE